MTASALLDDNLDVADDVPVSRQTAEIRQEYSTCISRFRRGMLYTEVCLLCVIIAAKSPNGMRRSKTDHPHFSDNPCTFSRAVLCLSALVCPSIRPSLSLIHKSNLYSRHARTAIQFLSRNSFLYKMLKNCDWHTNRHSEFWNQTLVKKKKETKNDA